MKLLIVFLVLYFALHLLVDLMGMYQNKLDKETEKSFKNTQKLKLKTMRMREQNKSKDL